MRFKFLSRFGASSASLPAAPAQPDGQDSEPARLSWALYQVLETLPQSFSGRENIRMLCDTLIQATPHLRLVWVGFTEGLSETVKPYTMAGPAQDEALDWSLPVDCFEPTGPCSESFQPQSSEAQGLFAPWSVEPTACSARAALSAPIRSEKAGLRGVIVFYADSADYFEQTGMPLMQAFCHVAEIVWKQSNLVRVATQVAQQDPLTGLFGRRQTMIELERAIARAERHSQPLSILLCRIDGLSKLNDMYGLQATDSILAAFAREVGELLREQDLAGRWSGTHFLFILPSTDFQTAESLAIRFGEHFRNQPVTVRNWSVRLALRLGTATHTRHSLGMDDLVLQAHHNLAVTNDELPSSVL